VADLEGGAAPAPTGLDAGASEDLRNRLRWISQYIAEGQIEDALAWCEGSLKSYPGRAEIWSDLGAVRMRQGRWAEAESAWQTALRHDPKSPGALYNLAVFERFYRLDRGAARRHFERFLTLGVEFDETLADRMAEDRK
jgi:tetratricopeptide (TPR) repeat protein